MYQQHMYLKIIQNTHTFGTSNFLILKIYTKEITKLGQNFTNKRCSIQNCYKQFKWFQTVRSGESYTT